MIFCVLLGKYAQLNHHTESGIMEKSKNKYTACCLVLVTLGTLLSTQKPPFYLDIIILTIAVVFGLIGYNKGEK